MSKVKTWKERIKAAKERGRFTWKDIELAKRWPTCAVGEHSERVKFVRSMTDNSPYYPVDYILQQLGNAFYDQVNHGKFTAAGKTYNKIQKRVKELTHGQ